MNRTRKDSISAAKNARYNPSQSRMDYSRTKETELVDSLLSRTIDPSDRTQGTTTRRQLNPYQRKEKEFNKLFKYKIKELRQNPTESFKALPESTLTHHKKGPELATYKKDDFKVVSNKLRMLAKESKAFSNRNLKILERFFDPLRIRLRVLPIYRAPLIQGKNSDFYFVEAAKISFRGDIPNAL